MCSRASPPPRVHVGRAGLPRKATGAIRSGPHPVTSLCLITSDKPHLQMQPPWGAWGGAQSPRSIVLLSPALSAPGAAGKGLTRAEPFARSMCGALGPQGGRRQPGPQAREAGVYLIAALGSGAVAPNWGDSACRGRLATSGDLCGCHTGTGLLVWRGWGPRRPSAPHCPGRPQRVTLSSVSVAALGWGFLLLESQMATLEKKAGGGGAGSFFPGGFITMELTLAGGRAVGGEGFPPE